MSALCGVTVLRTTGSALATKQWIWRDSLQEWSRRDYQAGSWFKPQEISVASLTELAAVLESLSRDPTAFIVRGALTDWAREGVASDPEFRIRRRKHKKGDVEPSLVEVLRSWVMIDIDGFPLPAWAALADDPEGVIAHAVEELLPEEFQGADFWWQLSSSAGFSHGVLKCHLFFWLAEPASNSHIKSVLQQHAPGVDRAPFSAAQPHFIAAPIIDGYDPLPRRTGWCQGFERSVVLPELRPEQPQPRPSGPATIGGAGGIWGALAFLGDGEGGQGFHAPIRTCVMRYAAHCTRHRERDDDAFKGRLRTAIRSAPRRTDRDVEGTYCSDQYLDASIRGAFALCSVTPDIQTMAPHHQAPRYSVEEARAAVSEHVEAFIRRAIAWHQLSDDNRKPPEHAAVVNDVGVGKSTITRRWLPLFIDTMKAAGLPHRILWVVPTHKLGAEAVTALADLGINVAVWRGREADEPGTADPGGGIPPMPMCRNLPAVEDAILVGEDVELAVCGSAKAGKPSCPFRAECAYQRQKKPVEKADVVVVAHQGLFHRLPFVVTDSVGLVCVDEAWWQSGLVPNRSLRLATFVEEAQLQPPHRDGFNWLAAHSLKAQRAFEATVDGAFVGRKAVMDAGLTADDCGEAIKLEWQRKVKDVLKPGMSPETRKQAMKAAAGNVTIPRRVAVWEALRALLAGGDEETGRLQMGTKADGDGAARVILLHSRLDVREDIAAVPLLCLDATMPVGVVRRFLPRLDVLAEIRAVTPHARIHQITGGWGKTSLVPSERASPEENRRRRRLVSEVADFIRLNSGGDALAVTYEAIEPLFRTDGVRTGHFNAIAGLDEFRDVRSLFVIGRPLPDADELRALALALTGKPIPAEMSQRETRGVLMADGSGQAATVRTYANPDLEALRVAITDAEVFQAIGRGRAVNRTTNTPLDIFVLADVVLPLPVTSLVRWEDARLGVLERMAARGCVLLGPTDAAKAYPDLFATPEAARKALDRETPGRDFPDISLRVLIHRGLSGKSLVRVTYRPAGRGQQTRQAWTAPSCLPTLREWLESLVGPLALYEVDDDPPPSPEPSQPTVTEPLDVEAPAEPPVVEDGDNGPQPDWADELLPLAAYADAQHDADGPEAWRAHGFAQFVAGSVQPPWSLGP